MDDATKKVEAPAESKPVVVPKKVQPAAKDPSTASVDAGTQNQEAMDHPGTGGRFIAVGGGKVVPAPSDS